MKHSETYIRHYINRKVRVFMRKSQLFKTILLGIGMIAALSGCGNKPAPIEGPEPTQEATQPTDKPEPTQTATQPTDKPEPTQAATQPTDKLEPTQAATQPTDKPEAPTSELEPTTQPGGLEPVTTDPVKYEAEDGTLTGKAKVETSRKNYSGTGYVAGLEGDGDSCTFHITVSQEGFYDLIFSSASAGGTKENYVIVDGEQMGTLSSTETEFTEAAIQRVYMAVGTHEVTVEKYWGWIFLDSLTVQGSEALPADLYEVSTKLCNPNATDEAKRLMSYLVDIYGKKFLSGQYSESMYGLERAAIWKTTGGKYPAVLGLDLIEYSPSRAANGSTSKAIEYAIECWEAGGIVTFAWHWNVPEKYLTDVWWKGFNTESVNIDLAKIMNGEDEEGYDLLVSDIDVIAEQLKRLQDAGVPVLWRPLHEAAGGWFWWGAAGADAYKQLYLLLYDRLTNYHGLNNLIWLWNGQSADWYPGDEYVDIIGEDIYAGERVYTSQVKKYLEAAAYSNERKMVVLSENGCLFDPDLAIRDGAMWGFFATWSGEFVLRSSNLNVLSEKYTEAEMVKKVYSHEAVVTLEDLPDLKSYPIH